VSALIVLVQTTITTMFGPTKALQGQDDHAVLTASKDMLEEQKSVMVMGAVTISCMFLGACVQTWVIMPRGKFVYCFHETNLPS
jgi:hypothetical protein